MITATSKVTQVISLSMSGFDLLAMGIGFFDPDNALVKLNQEPHSSALYNGFQIAVSALAIFTTGATSTMACFIAGTMILTAAGLVAIENIKAGDKVVSTNIETNENGEKPVARTFINESNELAHIWVNGEEIIATPSHLFYEVDKGWVFASSLGHGSILMLPDASRIEVERVTFETLKEPVKVYNFEVADWHTYHVGNAGVLVHNDCVQNKAEGLRRETEVKAELSERYPESEGYKVKSEALLRDSNGKKSIDPVTNTGRRIDFVVDKNGNIIDSIEVTSKYAPKDLQIGKELRIRANGGNYVKVDGKLLKIPDDLTTRIVRRY